MKKTTLTDLPESEAQLVALLATLKVEPAEELDFEGRFLSEFHERVAREAVCCPARRHVLAHLVQLVENIGRGRLAFGASVLGVAAVAVGFAMYPVENGVAGTVATVAKVESQLVPLQIPALSNDLADCTTIRVQTSVSPLETPGVMITRGQHSTIIEVPNAYVAPATHRNGGYVPLPAPSVRYAF